jgi:hypothetical protein
MDLEVIVKIAVKNSRKANIKIKLPFHRKEAKRNASLKNIVINGSLLITSAVSVNVVV